MVSRSIALASTALLLSACGSLNQIADESVPPGGIGNAIVIEDESFEASRGSVITVLQSHVGGMSVSRTDVCPHIVVRGGVGRSQVSEPLVYLDGQRISDTCILDGLNVESVSRVEVYPSGVTRRAGYHSHSGGLILVFMKNGSDALLW